VVENVWNKFSSQSRATATLGILPSLSVLYSPVRLKGGGCTSTVQPVRRAKGLPNLLLLPAHPLRGQLRITTLFTILSGTSMDEIHPCISPIRRTIDTSKFTPGEFVNIMQSIMACKVNHTDVANNLVPDEFVDHYSGHPRQLFPTLLYLLHPCSRVHPATSSVLVPTSLYLPLPWAC